MPGSPGVGTSRQRGRLVDEMSAAFSAAAERSGEVVERSVEIAGHAIRLKFAGQAPVEPLSKAFAHLPRPEREPDLVIEVWDSASTAGGAPPLLAGIPEGAPEKVRLLLDRWPVLAVYLPSEGSFSVVDHEASRAWFWTADAAAIPHWERAAPLRYILNGWFGARGHHVIHAGAVGEEDGGVLLLGKGGSGKSTTALTCVQAGLLYTGDDFSLVSTRPPMSHPLYSSGKLEADHVTRFPALVPVVDNADRLDKEKAIMFVDNHAPERLQTSFPIRAVAIPRVTGEPITRFSPASFAEALGETVIGTSTLMPGSSTTVMSAMAELLRQTACYRLELGTDLAAIPGVVRELLADAARDA